jgi:hypothetical protein
MKKTPKAPSETIIRALLARHGCPVPFHAVRTRFLGNIATPTWSASPLRVVERLWGGELPEFESVDEANALFEALVQGLWNDLTRHQKRTQPFRVTRVPMQPTAANLAHYASVRLEELDGFIDGLFGGAEAIDLPERAHMAVGHLTELRAIMAGVSDLMARDPDDASRAELEIMFKQLREVTRIMETEMNEAVLSCARARRRMLEGIPTQRPTLH